MATKDGQEGVFIPQELAQWLADYVSVNSHPTGITYGEVHQRFQELIQCSVEPIRDEIKALKQTFAPWAQNQKQTPPSEKND